MECIFCKIANNQLPASIIYQDDKVVAFNDIQPQAPHHLLIIPKKHIATLNDISETDAPILGHMVLIAKQLAKDLQVDQAGYRLVMNCNKDGGQAVYHIHCHLLAGRSLHWPPG